MAYTYNRVTNGEGERTQFGIGTNAKGADSGPLAGFCLDVACLCWFTSKGASLPLSIKFMDADGEVWTSEVRVRYQEEKNYDGIASIEYDCAIGVNGRERLVKLIFFKEECHWIMKEGGLTISR